MQPFVSILIPFRNEEKHAGCLLASIENLDYPKNRFEILLADDHSEDRTPEILSRFAQNHEYCRLFRLKDKKTNDKLKGKARALELLCRKARGEYFLFTDADIVLPTKWISAMIRGFQARPNLGVAIGVTGMKNSPFEQAMQGMEWISVLYILHGIEKLGIQGTGMGNNMAVSKKAYWATGGYSKIPFSIVEDHALYKAITGAGYGFTQYFEKEVLAYTVPPENLLKQRNRWIRGAVKGRSQLAWFGLLQSLWIPICLFFTFCVNLWFGLSLFLYPFVHNFFMIRRWEKVLQIKGYLKYFAIFSVYLPISWFWQLLYWLLNKKIDWKGRSY